MSRATRARPDAGTPPQSGKAARSGIAGDVVSGLATSLFNVPTGLAYAQLAGVNPVYGLYAGIVSTLVAALSTGTMLMISTITSAIALAIASVLDQAAITSAQLPQALFTLTFLTGVVMFVLGLLRLGSIVNFVSNAVMTGFVAGTALLIILGQEEHLTGYAPQGANQVQKFFDWLQHFSEWDLTSLAVGGAVIVLMLALQRVPALKKFAAILVLVVGTVVVNVLGIATDLVSSIATIPSGLPAFMLPNFALIPQLALGSISVAFVALAQGAAVNSAIPNPDGSRSNSSRDFIGQGLGNLAGSFFQSLSTGGALSQSAVSAEAGARSRWGGVFAALWLALIVLLFGQYAEKVPLAVIGGMLVVIGVQLILARVASAQLVIRSGDKGSIAAMALTFFSALFIPLQWTIFLGAALSLLLYVAASARKLQVQEAVRLEDGAWEVRDAPGAVRSNAVTILIVQGLDFFAEVPTLADRVPPVGDTNNAVVILVLRDLRHLTSSGVKWLQHYAEELKSSNGILMLADVNPQVHDVLRRTGALDTIGSEHVFPATARILDAENMAWQAAHAWLSARAAGGEAEKS